MKLFKKILFTILTSISAFTFVSCGNQINDENKQDKEDTTFVDYTIKDEARLALDYKNHHFLTDGVGQVELKTCIDGDTAHFTDSTSEEIIKCRFYGIDTPESTGKIQPYGKAASNFTKEKLTNASKNGTIVISVPEDEYIKPSHDSTGTRYLALIWINESKKDADYKDLILLNLLLVQNGYSEVKNATEMERLEPVFRSALDQARNLKLNLFSGKDDPLYNYGAYEAVSLLDMKKELEAEIEAHNQGKEYENKYNGMNVKVVGTVVGFANHILYIQNYYSIEDGGRYSYGEYAGINIYTGMTSIPTKFTKKNTYLQVCGTAVDSENFGFQISGCTFKAYNPGENDAQVLIAPEDNTDEFVMYEFNKRLDEISEISYECANSPVLFDEYVIVKGGYTSDSDSTTLYVTKEDGTKLDLNVFMSFIYKPDPTKPSVQWNNYEYFIGHTFKLAGICSLHKQTSGDYVAQIMPRDGEDFVLIN